MFTVSNGEYSVTDQSLEKDVPGSVRVVKSRLWEPFSAYKKLTGRKQATAINPGFLDEQDGTSFLQKAALWVRANVFIPDARRFWIKPAVKRLSALIAQYPFDVMITTGAAPQRTPHRTAAQA